MNLEKVLNFTYVVVLGQKEKFYVTLVQLIILIWVIVVDTHDLKTWGIKGEQEKSYY